MPVRFLRKLMKQPPSQELKSALSELARLAKEKPSLATAAVILAEILPPLFEEPVTEQLLPLDIEIASAKLMSGIPLLRGEAVNLDTTAFRRMWKHVCTAMRRHQDAEAPDTLSRALESGQLDAQEMVQEIVAGRATTIRTMADAQGLDPALTATVLRLTIFPFFVQLSKVLASLRHGFRWDQGYCPTCGSWPLLGEYRGLEQTRFLRCGLCAAGWEFPRLHCPFCGNHDHRQLGYLHIEELGGSRADTCDRCRGYVKMITTLSTTADIQLLIADVATTHLDLIAADHGYLLTPG